ncbi:MAG: T9SS type A sorting domain-containing protein [Saprospiraceae bacterium]|nr:T9SS type A sorting domain-containing protein [Saprospiraceae bacterium]
MIYVTRVFLSCILAILGSGTGGAFYAINQNIAALFTADSVAMDQLQATLRLVEEKLDSIAIIDELLPEADSIETISLWSERAALVDLLFNLDKDSRNIAADIWSYISDEAGKLHSQNDSIVVTEVYEYNEKEVNDIYLSWLSTAFGALDSTEMGALQAIAEQCPYEGGNAVYRARAFLTVLTQQYVSYNDSLLCVPLELLRARSDKEMLLQTAKDDTGLRIFPNPAHSEVKMIWKMASEKPGLIQVSDIYGRQIRQLTIAPDTSELVMPLENMPDGMYIFRIRLDGLDLVRKVIVKR